MYGNELKSLVQLEHKKRQHLTFFNETLKNTLAFF